MNPRPLGYGPSELPLLHPAMLPGELPRRLGGPARKPNLRKTCWQAQTLVGLGGNREIEAP